MTISRKGFISTFAAAIFCAAALTSCGQFNRTHGELVLGDLPYTWSVETKLLSKLSVVRPSSEFSQMATADGVRSQAIVMYMPHKGPKVIFMSLYLFPSDAFEVANHPDEPPLYGTKVLENNGMVLSAAGPQDSIFIPNSPDGKNISSLYAQVLNPKSYHFYSRRNTVLGKFTIPNIQGCYVAKLKADIFTLEIIQQLSKAIKAKIRFSNANKDSSAGILDGTFDGTILKGVYTFQSEGTTSRSELIFKKVKSGFIQGFGPSEVKQDLSSFTRPLNIRWESNYVFTPSSECSS